MSGLDWPGLMRAGLCTLKLTPDQFWRLTPNELFLMLGVQADARPFGMRDLDALAARFPDVKDKTDGSS